MTKRGRGYMAIAHDALREKPKLARAFWAFLAAAILVADFVSGQDIHLPILYLIPLLVAAYFEGLWAGAVVAVVLPFVRWIFHFHWEDAIPSLEAAINSALLVAVLVFIVFLVDKSARQERELNRRMNALEGLVPICSGCKKIRREDGEYEPVEKYVSERSDAVFSHGMCPECIKKWYPELSDKGADR